MSPAPLVRPAEPRDVPALFQLIRALAEYEHLSEAVTGNAERLAKDLFGEPRRAEARVAEADGELVGFALFFGTYSTFLTQPGVYLEDLFVVEAYRRRGVGRALLASVARVARERGAGRLEWAVLDWNRSAIEFYERSGATLLPDWRICRVRGEALESVIAALERGQPS